MKHPILLLLALAAFAVAPAFGQQGSNQPANSAAVAAPKYTCPMHPEVVSDKPGKCPKCGMNLVKQEKK